MAAIPTFLDLNDSLMATFSIDSEIQFPMEIAATKEMCFLCFETVENAATKNSSKVVSSRVIITEDSRAFPLFVTWELSGELRGCIGSFQPLPLWSGLQEYAIKSSMKDPRFSPISSKELSNLSVTVSLLHSFEDCATPTDWEVGRHGIRLLLHGRRSTFLPEVAEEENWTKEETLIHLARKGGFFGQYDADAIARSTVSRYQSSKISAPWEEYQQFLHKCSCE
jgi:uncharacterized protein (TIGR00296 family)